MRINKETRELLTLLTKIKRIGGDRTTAPRVITELVARELMKHLVLIKDDTRRAEILKQIHQALAIKDGRAK